MAKLSVGQVRDLLDQLVGRMADVAERANVAREAASDPDVTVMAAQLGAAECGVVLAQYPREVVYAYLFFRDSALAHMLSMGAVAVEGD